MRSMQGDLLLLGAGGKMGPSLAMLARNALTAAGSGAAVIAVSRYSDPAVRRRLEEAGVTTVSADLLDEADLAALPDAPNVIYMPAMKFGSSGQAPRTWAVNTYLAGRAAARYAGSRIVAFSSGNVYPLVPVTSGGAREQDPTGPVGEYAWSVLGRERLFEHFSLQNGTPVALLRLNYAVELRYGVLVDIAVAVKSGEPIDVSMGNVNVVWQGDANEWTLRALGHCSSPATVLNITGPETLSVRQLAERLGVLLGVEPRFVGEEQPNALLNNASVAHSLFGYPRLGVQTLLELVAAWVGSDGELLGRPTKFQVRSGAF